MVLAPSDRGSVPVCQRLSGPCGRVARRAPARMRRPGGCAAVCDRETLSPLQRQGALVRVTVLHNAVSDNPTADERDVLVQADVVTAALTALGHEVQRLPCSLDLASARRQLAGQRPDVVFNLVEALGGSDRLVALA